MAYVPDGDPCPRHPAYPSRLGWMPHVGLYSQCEQCITEFFEWFSSHLRERPVNPANPTPPAPGQDCPAAARPRPMTQSAEALSGQEPDSTKAAQRYVYALRDPQSGLIKIGVSKSPISRWRQIRRLCKEPLEHLGFLPGSRDTERQIHVRFGQFRVWRATPGHQVMGEWFTPAEPVLEWVETLDRPWVQRGDSPIVDGLRDGSLSLEQALDELLLLAARLGEEVEHGWEAHEFHFSQRWPGIPVQEMEIEVEYRNAREAFLVAWRQQAVGAQELAL